MEFNITKLNCNNKHPNTLIIKGYIINEPNKEITIQYAANHIIDIKPFDYSDSLKIKLEERLSKLLGTFINNAQLKEKQNIIKDDNIVDFNF